ncbi:MAG: hypothetical protein IAE91_09270 [Ignavibacteriaceae bacterium]|nr:hypothetical protein [Ignavibacteriaceae bacterium]
MKTEKFLSAIHHRFRVKFYYSAQEFVVDPYLISFDKNGNKILYAKEKNSDVVKKFDYKGMCNLKVLTDERFVPAIPVIPVANLKGGSYVFV